MDELLELRRLLWIEVKSDEDQLPQHMTDVDRQGLLLQKTKSCINSRENELKLIFHNNLLVKMCNEINNTECSTNNAFSYSKGSGRIGH